MKFVELITGGQKDIWNNYDSFRTVFDEAGAPLPPIEHLKFIEKNGGEKIAALSDDEKTILGWIGIIPKNLSGYAELAGIEVHREHRNEKIASRLIERAQCWLAAKGIFEFRFSTSPLLTSNTLLYMKKFNSSYAWNNTMSLPPDNILWPVVDCVMNWKSPREKSKNSNPGSDLPCASILQWNGLVASIDEAALDGESDRKIVELPFLSLPVIFDQYRLKNYSVTETPFYVFETLNKRGYRFDSFFKESGKYYYLLTV